MQAERCKLCEAGSFEKLSVGAFVTSQLEPAGAKQGAQGSQIEPARASQGAQGSQIESARAIYRQGHAFRAGRSSLPGRFVDRAMLFEAWQGGFVDRAMLFEWREYLGWASWASWASW